MGFSRSLLARDHGCVEYLHIGNDVSIGFFLFIHFLKLRFQFIAINLVIFTP